MAYIPQVAGNTELSAETLTAIGSDIGVGVTVLQDSVETLHAYGDVILTNTALMNTWCSALMNKIVKPRLIAKVYKNRLAVTQKGVLSIGDGVEEIFTVPANVHKANNDTAHPTNPFNADLPDVKTAWHVTNAEMTYSTRKKKIKLRRAFISFEALEEFVNSIVQALYNRYEWNSQILVKYKLAQMILARIAADKVVEVPSPVTSDGTGFLAAAREYAGLFDWMSNEYNDAGVPTFTSEDDKYIIMPVGVEAHVDVKDLAAAFNLDYANFLGRRLPVDRFTFSSIEKADIMTIGGLAEWPFTEEQETALSKVIGVLCDINIVQFYDTFEPELWSIENPGEAEICYWLHAAKVCGISPFADAVVFVEGADEPETMEVQPRT